MTLCKPGDLDVLIALMVEIGKNVYLRTAIYFLGNGLVVTEKEN
jgi:hypothetical protein